MCNLAEYIVARRAMHIVCCLSNPDCEEAQEASKFRSFFGSDLDSLSSNGSALDSVSAEEAVQMQQRMQDLFTLLIEGSTLKRFVGVNTTSENVQPETTPIFLLEVFEPSHAWIPLYITNRSVVMISPFPNPLLAKAGGSKYVFELFPISLIKECKTFADVNKVLFEPFLEGDSNYTAPTMGYEFKDEGVNPEDGVKPNSPSYADIINEAIKIFSCGIQNSDKAVGLGNTSISSDKVLPVSMESFELKALKSKYGLESLQHFLNASESDDGVIGLTDYMPIFVSDGEDHGPAVYEKTDDEGVYKVSFRPRIGGHITKDESIAGVLTKENLKYGKVFVIELDTCCYYAGKGQIGCADEHGGVKVQPICDYMYNEGDEVASAEEEHGIGTESAITAVGQKAKAFAVLCKKFGLKSGTAAFNGLKIFLKLPTSVAKNIFNSIMSIFKSANTIEKEQALELQERLINDEVDVWSEKLKMFGEVQVRSMAWTAFIGWLWLFPIVFLIQRSKSKKIRRKALDRLELRLDEAMERIKRKIRHAEERSEAEDEDKLMKELEKYKLAKMKLLEIKTQAFDGEKIKYATFDKDLTLKPASRIDNLLRGSGTSDY